MITYYSQDHTFTLERSPYRPRREAWHATLGYTLSQDGGTVIARAHTQDALMVLVAQYIRWSNKQKEN